MAVAFDPRAARNRPQPVKGVKLSGRDKSDLTVDHLADTEVALKTLTTPAAEDSATRQRAKAENKRFEDVTDSEYWVAVCFESRDQKEQFLKLLNLWSEDLSDKYVNGPELARRLGIPLTPDPSSRRAVQVNRRWSKHVPGQTDSTRPTRPRPGR